MWIGRLKKASQHKTKWEKNFEKHSIDLFTLDFFGVVFLFLGENIWKILSAQYVVDQLKRFGKMQPEQDTEWDVRKATQKQVANQWVQKSTPQFLFQVKNLSSKE